MDSIDSIIRNILNISISNFQGVKVGEEGVTVEPVIETGNDSWYLTFKDNPILFRFDKNKLEALAQLICLDLNAKGFRGMEVKIEMDNKDDVKDRMMLNYTNNPLMPIFVDRNVEYLPGRESLDESRISIILKERDSENMCTFQV